MWPPATVADGCGSPIDLVSYCLSLYKWCLVIKSRGISGNTRCSFLGNWIASFPFLENFFLAYGKTMKRHYFLWSKRRKKNGWNDCDFSFQLRKQIYWLQTVFTFFVNDWGVSHGNNLFLWWKPQWNLSLAGLFSHTKSAM